MALVLTIIFASTVCYMPGHAEPIGGYAGANAVASANSASTGSSASATSNSYAYLYPSNSSGLIRDCTYNRCTPTCSIPHPKNCPSNSNPCGCPSGTIISETGGKCVSLQQCQSYINCNGDYNAQFTQCSAPCPSTCAKPNFESCHTNRCSPGCECKSGFILSGKNGKCIKPEACPGGYPCNRNQTYINCFVDCPSIYCPVDETRVACGAPSFCRGECACKYNYLRKSVNDYTCILESECPPGKCYGPNEQWTRCVSLCFSDSCKDRNKVPVPGDCPFSPTECYPRCLCKKGYYRNGRTCVPVQNCPADGQ